MERRIQMHGTQSCQGHCFQLEAERQQWADPDNVETAPASHSLPAGHPESISRLYNKLRPWQTRVLRLLPGQRSEHVAADLLVANLVYAEGVVLDVSDEQIAYGALSYTWGSGKRHRGISINSVGWPVSGNLHSALRMYRSETEVRYLWVDALCINQRDNEEKSVQVANMLNIYTKARTVVVWLGASANASDLAFQCLRERAMLEDKLSRSKASRHHASCVKDLTTLHSSLRHLYERPWMRRVWIRQEIYAARSALDITVNCGSQTCTWNQFDGGRSLLKIIGDVLAIASIPLSFQRPDIAIDLLLNDIWDQDTQHLGSKKPRNIYKVLLMSRHFRATDPRDFVYASLGMSGVSTTTSSGRSADKPQIAFPIDYEISESQVVQAFAAHLLLHGVGADPFRSLLECYIRKLATIIPSNKNHSETPQGLDEGRDSSVARTCDPNTLLDLPSWAMHWRTTCCPDTEAALIMSADQTLLASFRSSPGKSFEYFKRPSQPSPGVCSVTGKVINFLAEVTDWTVDLEWFLQPDIWSNLLYSPQNPIPPPVKSGRSSGLRENLVAFDPTQHHRRLAFLDSSKDSLRKLALVPATARPNDVVVLLAHQSLPLVFRSGNASPTTFSHVSRKDWRSAMRTATRAVLSSDLKVPSDAAQFEVVQARASRVASAVRELGPDFEFQGPAFAYNDAFTTLYASGHTKLWTERQRQDWADSIHDTLPLQTFNLH